MSISMKAILTGIATPTPLVKAGALTHRHKLRRVNRSHPNFKTINQSGKVKARSGQCVIQTVRLIFKSGKIMINVKSGQYVDFQLPEYQQIRWKYKGQGQIWQMGFFFKFQITRICWLPSSRISTNQAKLERSESSRVTSKRQDHQPIRWNDEGQAQNGQISLI